MWYRRKRGTPFSRCSCGFELWHPLAWSDLCAVGIYDDARFPGRMIVSLRRHYSSVGDIPPRTFGRYMKEVQRLGEVQREALGSDRVNLAILGNHEPHVHCHLIPRRFELEERPQRSPWDDPRPRIGMGDEVLHDVCDVLARAIGNAGFYTVDLASSLHVVRPRTVWVPTREVPTEASST